VVPRTIFGRKLETPVGPAAGPHTQLAQNIAAAYYAGARFFELKTVQTLDGEDLPVSKPCIKADDECYNCEWSTELRVSDALAEYIKAWFLLHVLAIEWGLGAPDGFQFNMSVGYDLAGIRSEKIDTFIETLKDAGASPVFEECRAYLLAHIGEFSRLKPNHVESISPHICNSATLSTLHGCPPQEIERIAAYLLGEKGLHTFVKCNPTLLGYDFARATLDAMGYDYIAFGDFHFRDDLQYADAVPMLKRLMALAQEKDLEFGVKLTNTFPVDVTQGELPSAEMYMSGKSLYPLTVSLASELSADFGGRLRISYSGGADVFNVGGIVDVGIWPVTVASTLLKAGGYERLRQLAEATCLHTQATSGGSGDAANQTAPIPLAAVPGGPTGGTHGARVTQDAPDSAPSPKAPVALEGYPHTFSGVDAPKLAALAARAVADPRHTKAVKPLPGRKSPRKVPLTDCFMAPCHEGCPIHQDIPAYLEAAGRGDYAESLRIITERNALPFITGTICAHNCMGKCTRNFYEDPVDIRRVKLLAAQGGFEDYIKDLGAGLDACATKPPQSSQPVESLPCDTCATKPPQPGQAVESLPPSIGCEPRAAKPRTVAIVGGGPAGLAAAFYLSRAGACVTLYEKTDTLGGVVRRAIPAFRIGDDAIDRDVRMVRAMVESSGGAIHTGFAVRDLAQLRSAFDAVVVAVGAYEPGRLDVPGCKAINALDFLAGLKGGAAKRLSANGAPTSTAAPGGSCAAPGASSAAPGASTVAPGGSTAAPFDAAVGGKADATPHSAFPDIRSYGRHIVVIGGGNTAMDTARAAKRALDQAYAASADDTLASAASAAAAAPMGSIPDAAPGHAQGTVHGKCAAGECADGKCADGDAPTVSLVYRRTKRYMPADEEELLLAEEDGVEFRELLAPLSWADRQLTCEVMELSAPDANGRRGVAPTGETAVLPADTVVAAVGEKTPAGFYEGQGITAIDPATMESNIPGIYVIGDGRRGPSTVVEAMADAIAAAESITGQRVGTPHMPEIPYGEAAARHGSLSDPQPGAAEPGRCLTCNIVCENCVEVCPNRANVRVAVPIEPGSLAASVPAPAPSDTPAYADDLAGATDRPSKTAGTAAVVSGAAGFSCAPRDGISHQILHLDFACNECGNCRTFCPYDSAPYLDKFTLFADVSDMENSQNQGFAFTDWEKGSVRIRIGGDTADRNASDPSPGAGDAIPATLWQVIRAVYTSNGWLAQ
jgi:NADPH-dependent glutamate synthase beta subunit-like oxidoreductase